MIQRGNNRAACFYADTDRAVYLQLLSDQAAKFGCALHAYVLMTNHVHLLLTPAVSDGPSLLMKHLGQRYVQYFNRKHGRSGTLWEGRFRSSIVQEQRYFLACSRYIELNPVRAGMVQHPRDYEWSSYRVNGESQISPFLTPHAEYLALGSDTDARASAYRSLLGQTRHDREIGEIREALNGGFALGNERFKSAIAKLLSRRVERGTPGRPRKERRSLYPQGGMVSR